jgi:sigma-B regulation protein RsbU (phosphoserine phosphatase)
VNVSHSWLGRFLQQQSLYLAVSAILTAVFWSTGQPINPATIITYSLLFGNLVAPTMDKLRPIYWQRSFPYNWILFLLILLVVLPPVYVITTSIVWVLVPPAPPQTLWHLISTGWRLPILVIFVYCVISFIYRQTSDRLKQRNLELQRTVELGSAKLEMQEQELKRAREIQQSLLPKEIPQLAGFEIAAAWRPALAVSGDYFDVFKLGDNKLGICIADVAGKGVSAALLMANVQAAVRAFANETEQPAALCSKVNQLLCGNIASGKFVTFLYGTLDRSGRTLRYCNAGHLPPIFVSQGEAHTLDGGGAVLGVFSAWQYEQAQVEMQPGDRVLLFTDGISEAADAHEQEFGELQLASCARRNSSASAAELNAAVMSEVDTFCGSHFHDDATLLVISAK